MESTSVRQRRGRGRRLLWGIGLVVAGNGVLALGWPVVGYGLLIAAALPIGSLVMEWIASD